MFLIGTEFSTVKILNLRAGYRYRTTNNEFPFPYSLSFGFGFNIKSAAFDYSFTSYEKLGLSRKVSITINFAYPQKITELEEMLEEISKDYEIESEFLPISRSFSINHYKITTQKDLCEISFGLPFASPLEIQPEIEIFKEPYSLENYKFYKTFRIKIKPDLNHKSITTNLRYPIVYL